MFRRQLLQLGQRRGIATSTGSGGPGGSNQNQMVHPAYREGLSKIDDKTK
jgi:hypothetical protein